MTVMVYRFAHLNADLFGPTATSHPVQETPFFVATLIRVGKMEKLLDAIGGTDDADNPLPNLVLDVARASPDGVSRNVLRTRAFRQPIQPHDGFTALHVIHDAVGHYDSYDEPDSDGPEPDEVVRHYFVYPMQFFAYASNHSPGNLYVTTPLVNLKEVFRRYRVTTNHNSAQFIQRVVDLRALEKTLESHQNAEIIGYALRNVPSDTTINSLSVYGQQMAINGEVQNLKDRAEKVRILRFRLQHGTSMLRMSIDEQGAVRFASVPGDTSALELLQRLEPHIEAHSQMRAVTVSQGGGM